MDLKRTWSEWSKVQRGIAIGVAALLVALIAIFAFVKLHRSRNLANTMRLIRKEGFVFLEENNELKTVTNNMRFQSGDVLTTGKQSLASISLDDTKIITMEEQSTVDFSKSGKQLELKLRSGKIYFEVNKPLEQDESMYIQTSNMIVGIRGTAGYVFYDREGHQCVLLTSGEVTISATNPWTGETKTTTVKAGQLLITYLYSDRTTDSVMFELMEADSIPADMDPSGIETIPSDVSETTLETQESTSATTKATSTTKNASETSEPDEGGNRPSGTPKHPPTMTPAPVPVPVQSPLRHRQHARLRNRLRTVVRMIRRRRKARRRIPAPPSRRRVLLRITAAPRLPLPSPVSRVLRNPASRKLPSRMKAETAKATAVAITAAEAATIRVAKTAAITVAETATTTAAITVAEITEKPKETATVR